jgi:hypothetical protein
MLEASVPTPSQPDPVLDLRPNFHRLLGDVAWRRLPEAVRVRFASHVELSAVTYRGRMKVQAT